MTRIFLYILLFTAAVSCREKYILPDTGPARGYLVVDGVINSGVGPTTIRISRTQALIDSNALRYERSAMVRVEGEDNSNFLLYEQENGVYRSDQLSLNPAIKYRLHIYTIDDKEYLTDYALPLKTPPIDDITWEQDGNGIMLFANTHDPQNNTRFYRWEADETWEFHSPYIAQLAYVRFPNGSIRGVDDNTPTEMAAMYTCWATESPKSLMIGTSKALSRDSIHLGLFYIVRGSWKISVLYSVNVKQYALTEEGFDFLQRMKKNTEQMGTLFDPQPSQLNSNVRCVSDPEEPVIGFVEVSEVQQKRVFIKPSDVAPWYYDPGCGYFVIKNNLDSIRLIADILLPTTAHEFGTIGELLSFKAADPICVDCRLRGTPVKPSFWP